MTQPTAPVPSEPSAPAEHAAVPGSPAQARIAVLLDHPGEGDTRVIATVRALMRGGHCVRLFTLHRRTVDASPPQRPTSADLLDLDVLPIDFDDREIVPGWQRLAGRRPNKARPAGAVALSGAADTPPGATSPSRPAPSPRPADRQVRAAPARPPVRRSWVGRLNATLGALFWHRAAARAMAAPLARFSPDLIIANDLTMLGAGVAAGRALGARVVYDAHEYEAGRNGVQHTLAEAVRQAFEPLLLPRADAVVTVSESIAEQLRADHARARAVAVVPNAAPVAPAEPDHAWRASLDLPHDARLALHVGSLAAGRGLEHVIDALAGVPDLVFACIGHVTPERQAALELRAAQAGVTARVRILPPVPSDHVGAVVATADFTVIAVQPSCTSYRLCLPNKLFQSLSVGTPVVATPLPEIEAVLDWLGEGVVADGFDAPALQQALKRAATLRNKGKPDLAQLEPFGRAAADARWNRLARNMLEGAAPDREMHRLPHADSTLAALPPRPPSETTPRGWRRMLGRVLVAVVGRASLA